MNGTSSESSSQRHDLGLHSFMTAISIAGNGISSSISNLWERWILCTYLVQNCQNTAEFAYLVSPSSQRQLSGSSPPHMAFMSRSGLTRVSVLRVDPSAQVQTLGRHLCECYIVLIT